jgi:hypothetical protein
MIPFEGNEFLVLTQEKNDHLHELSVYVFLASDNWVKTLIVRCCFMFHYIMFHAAVSQLHEECLISCFNLFQDKYLANAKRNHVTPASRGGR